jgi:phage/plasmid-associated DNA primase
LKDSGTLKKLTGGDLIPAERKYLPTFYFLNYSKQIFSANTIPKTPDETDAFFARLIITNFPKQFIEGANADPYLFEKISTDKELSGFLYILLKRLHLVGEDLMVFQPLLMVQFTMPHWQEATLLALI